MHRKVAAMSYEHAPIVVWDQRARLWSSGTFATGGSPWGLIRLKPAMQGFAQELVAAGSAGLRPTSESEMRAARALVHRGLAHPQSQHRQHQWDVEVVVPAHDRVDALDDCLRSLQGFRVLVIDDCSQDSSAVTEVVHQCDARVIVREVNGGPAAARNEGIHSTTTEFIAFVDSDCAVPSSWLDALMPLFDDPIVGAVAPRIRPRVEDESLTTKFEAVASALDMGAHAEVVRIGGQLAYLPAAVLIVRRSAIPEGGFDEELRLGEDVDLIWRMVEEGWQVRYDPKVIAEHELRGDFLELLKRRFDYGTSAVDLDTRHPGALTPARISGWNLIAAAGVAMGQPGIVLSALGTATHVLQDKLHREHAPLVLTPFFVAKTLQADAHAVGHILRREYWPLGWTLLAASPKAQGVGGRLARLAAASMVLPLLHEWRATKPGIDPVRFIGMRLLADAAYGSGVLAKSAQRRSIRALKPQVRFPLPTASTALSDERDKGVMTSKSVVNGLKKKFFA